MQSTAARFELRGEGRPALTLKEVSKLNTAAWESLAVRSCEYHFPISTFSMVSFPVVERVSRIAGVGYCKECALRVLPASWTEQLRKGVCATGSPHHPISLEDAGVRNMAGAAEASSAVTRMLDAGRADGDTSGLGYGPQEPPVSRSVHARRSSKAVPARQSFVPPTESPALVGGLPATEDDGAAAERGRPWNGCGPRNGRWRPWLS